MDQQAIKQLEKIATELTRLNKNFEKMLLDMERARRKLTEPVIDINAIIGSEGEKKESEK